MLSVRELAMLSVLELAMLSVLDPAIVVCHARWITRAALSPAFCRNLSTLKPPQKAENATMLK